MTNMKFVTCDCMVKTENGLFNSYINKCDTHKDLDDQEAFEAALQLSRDNQPPKEFTPVRPMYMRLALLQMGMLQTIETALENPALAVQRIAWEYALEFKRNDAMINGFSQQMGLTTEQVDALFDLGAQLQSQA